tara:strand:+ start:1133 stop:1435 length:303 start_codon:yes stop_codon:yes gene_type:complete
MSRITDKILEAKISRLNAAAGTPATPYVTAGTPGQSDYKITAQPGNYHLSGAYGGVSLCQMATEGGGTHDVFRCGHVPKRDLAARIDAYAAGFAAGKGTA